MPKPTPELVASCMAALMQNTTIRDSVNRDAINPAGGGYLKRWTHLSYEYAEEICKVCENPETLQRFP